MEKFRNPYNASSEVLGENPIVPAPSLHLKKEQVDPL